MMGITKINPAKYHIFICHKCKGQVQEKDMGKKCPHCQEWLYHYLSKKECVICEDSA